jgi:RNA polymerase sigma-54 factor
MAFELRQNLKLTQQLIMTPQLQQAIKLLQLSRLELQETISQEMETNPVLEEAQDDITESDEAVDASPLAEEPIQEIEVSGKVREDFDWEAYLGDYSTSTPVLFESNPNQEWASYDHKLTHSNSLGGHLFWQLRFSDLTDREQEIGAIIIGSLDDNGYLDSTLEEIAAFAKADVTQIEKVLFKIQQFDPAGVAARDLKECLLVQARQLEFADELVIQIIENHLQALENKNYSVIVRALKRDPADVKAAIEVILSLDPRPGSFFNEETVQYVSPDVYVFKVDDDFVIVLNEDGMPKLRVSSYYKEALNQERSLPSEAKEYIQTKLRSAAWLIKSIHQRQRTLYKVAQSIVKFQREFFENGIGCLKPMVLRDVAEDVDMHESTISRVTTNKYMDTPQGIFELKYFFNSSISSVAGGTVASESVKERIRQIIQGENTNRPYSDKEIVEILTKENVQIARRTVAKYREMLNILPSSKRKKRNILDI